MIRRDTLWKGIIEDLAEDFLHFFFPAYIDEIDLDRKLEFLDKDLEQIMPESDTKRRHADKLFKAWLKNGQEQWFLVHVEVQGYPDGQFAYRMFQYYYRILDRYDKPVTAVVIYTDTKRSYHAKAYHYDFMGTELNYRFQSLVLIDHTAEELRASGNPFGFALEVARNALDLSTKDDEQLLISKVDMMRHLLSCGLSKAKVRRLYNFINMYVSFQNLENKLKFEKEVRKITKSREPMGLEEAILKEVREQSLEQGIEKGIDQEKQLTVIRGYENGVALELIAKVVDLSLDEVKRIIASHTGEDATN
ncbi:MAG: Rpn family recombination-promoting nuclease/putative transposase [bacterium]|nr:Rpn family recombination-promoting nuclease/putative transposase [bacterium]